MFILTIDTSNASFDDDRGVTEICRILEEVIIDLSEDNSNRQKIVKDINGNKVGKFTFTY